MTEKELLAVEIEKQILLLKEELKRKKEILNDILSELRKENSN